MVYYSKAIISKVKQIDLLTYLKIYEPTELICINKDNYCTKTHDSLKISNGMWYWFSRGIGSNNALDYLVKVRNFNFIEAVGILNNCLKANKILSCDNIQKEKNTKLILPDKDDNNNKIIDYLVNRGIDKEIIDDCISKNLIYQTKDKHNIVFVGFDKNNVARYGFERGTNLSRYMHDLSGSHKAFSFRLKSNQFNDNIHIFESSIDLLSYATLLKINNVDWKSENYLSLGGVYQPPKDIVNGKVPISLLYYLNQNPNTKKIILHLDNDKAGRMSTKILINSLSSKYEVVDEPSHYGKDINDFLLFINGMEINNRCNIKEKFSDR